MQTNAFLLLFYVALKTRKSGSCFKTNLYKKMCALRLRKVSLLSAISGATIALKDNICYNITNICKGKRIIIGNKMHSILARNFAKVQANTCNKAVETSSRFRFWRIVLISFL